jgi:riboflavin biosynthesis pyrimidine reductase
MNIQSTRTDLSSIRFAVALGASFIYVWVAATAHAQIMPYVPSLPTAISECQSFSRDLAEYEAAYTQQHEECLASHKADHPDEAPGSPICSRSTCQYLHDYLFGDSYSSVKSLKQKLSACYDAVREREVQAAKYREADAARNAEEEDGRKAREAEEQKQGQLDRDNRQKREQDLQNAKDKQRAAALAREQQEVRESTTASRAEGDRSTKQRVGPPLPTPDGASSPKIVDPFGDTGSSRKPKPESDSVAKMADPFPSSDAVVDPFGASVDTDTTNSSSDNQKALFEASSKTIELSTKAIDSKLDLDIAQVASQSGVTINPSKATVIVQEIKETKSLLNSIAGFATKAQYAILFKNVIYAETPAKEEEALGEVGKQIAGDVLRSDLVNEGIKTVAPRLFGKSVGLVLAGAAPLAIESGGILLDSVKTDRDPTEMIRDASGKVSLTEKQEALVQMWHGYERRQSQTGHNPPSNQLNRELWTNTNIVYNECLEAKGNCDHWKSLVAPH